MQIYEHGFSRNMLIVSEIKFQLVLSVEFGNVNSEHSHYSQNEIQKEYIHRS